MTNQGPTPKTIIEIRINVSSFLIIFSNAKKLLQFLHYYFTITRHKLQVIEGYITIIQQR